MLCESWEASAKQSCPRGLRQLFLQGVLLSLPPSLAPVRPALRASPTSLIRAFRSASRAIRRPIILSQENRPCRTFSSGFSRWEKPGAFAETTDFIPHRTMATMVTEFRQPQLARAEIAALLPPWTALQEKGGALGAPEPFSFGQWKIDAREIFLLTTLSFAFVNQKPIVPGHVLVVPRRVAQHFSDLSGDEVSDLWLAAQRVGHVMKFMHKTDALTFAIQDGQAAGQTVTHVHIHVVPRRAGDFQRNDEVYQQLETSDLSRAADQGSASTDEGAAKGAKAQPTTAGLDDKDRKPRTPEEMHAEAAEIVEFIRSSIPE